MLQLDGFADKEGKRVWTKSARNIFGPQPTAPANSQLLGNEYVSEWLPWLPAFR